MKTAAKKLLKKTGYVFISLIILLFMLRLLFIDVYRIPSDSMKNKFSSNDYIFINKTLYSSAFSVLADKLDLATPHSGDIFVFTIRKEIPGFFVKRCIGLPGSTVEVRNSVLSVDGNTVKEPPSVRHYYKIWFNDYQQLKTDIAQAGIDKLGNSFKRFPRYIFMALDNFQKNKLRNGIDSFTIWKGNSDPDSLNINVPELSEDIPDMNALKIPFKGMKIFFSEQLPAVYESTIRIYEDSSIQHIGKNVFIKGKVVDSYTFKKDYLFMMGDNRDIAIDSRHYGVVPRENLVGKYIGKL
jgi:signal peptidase I